MFGHDYFMHQALALAHEAYERGEIPVGCIVVSQNHILAKSYNLTETLNDVTAHAEMQAITSAATALGGKYLRDCTLYVTLEPCVMCAGALSWSQISRVVIGARDLQRGFSAKGLTLHPKTEIIWDILSEESSELMKKFFQERR